MRERLNRADIDSQGDLMSSLGNLEHLATKSLEKTDKIGKQAENKKPLNRKPYKPCSNCDKLGYHDRYHPEAKCWNNPDNLDNRLSPHKPAPPKQNGPIRAANGAKLRNMVSETKKKLSLTPLIIKLQAHIWDRTARALYDPGANISMINDKFVKKLKQNIIPIRSYACKTMGGVRLLTGAIKVKLKIMDIQRTVWLYVIKDDNFDYDLLLGLDCIQIFHLNMDYKLNITQTEKDDKDENIHSITNENNNIPIAVNWNEGIPIDKFIAETEHLPKGQKYKIKKLIIDNKTLFARNRYDGTRGAYKTYRK